MSWLVCFPNIGLNNGVSQLFLKRGMRKEVSLSEKFLLGLLGSCWWKFIIYFTEKMSITLLSVPSPPQGGTQKDRTPTRHFGSDF